MYFHRIACVAKLGSLICILMHSTKAGIDKVD